MALTLATMLDEFSQFTGDVYYSGTTDAAGSSTTFVDSTLYGRYTRNDEIKNLWILLTSGTYSGSKRLLFNGASTVYTATTGTGAWLKALAGNSGSGVTYQLHGIDPQYKIDALNTAARLCSKYLYQPMTDYIITNSPVINGCFTWWDATNAVPVGWTKSNAALTSVRNSGPNNNFVAKLTSSDGSARWLESRPTFYSDSLALAGKTISLYCDMQSDTANHARPGILLGGSKTYMNEYFDYNSTTTTSGYMPADSLWYRAQRESISVGSTVGTLQFLMEIASATAVTRFSKFYITGGPQMRTYPLVGNWLKKPMSVAIQQVPDLTREGFVDSAWDELNFDYREIDSSPDFPSTSTNRVARLTLPAYYPDGYLVKIEGDAALTSVSAMTDTMQVDNDTAYYLYANAQQVLFTRLAGEARANGDDVKASDYDKQAEDGFKKAKMWESTGEHITPDASSTEIRGWF